MSDNEEQVSAESADAPPESDAEPTDAEPGEEISENEATPSESEGTSDTSESVDLLDRVREADEGLADAVEERLIALHEEREELRKRVDEREQEVEDLESRLKRKQADFQNYKKRAKKRQDQLQERATEDLVSRLVEVRDNLVRALQTDHDDIESIREGVEMTLREFDRILDAENVATIDPEPGTAVDPQRHEVMMRVASDQPADTVAEVYRPGYAMGEKVVRAAQVTVSEGGNGDEEANTDEDANGDE